jgi:hypothetical protein
MDNAKQTRVRADFNGLFGDILCLSHSDTAPDENGNPVMLREGMRVLAYEQDSDEDGTPDNLIAFGIVDASPPWLRCNGSKWILRIDQNGVRHESELAEDN